MHAVRLKEEKWYKVNAFNSKIYESSRCTQFVNWIILDDEGSGGVDSHKTKKKLRFCDACS